MLLSTAEVISGPALRATAMTLKLLDTTLSEKCLLNHSRIMFCYTEGEEEKSKTRKSVFTQVLVLVEKWAFSASVKGKTLSILMQKLEVVHFTLTHFLLSFPRIFAS